MKLKNATNKGKKVSPTLLDALIGDSESFVQIQENGVWSNLSKVEVSVARAAGVLVLKGVEDALLDEEGVDLVAVRILVLGR